ncbi:glycosyltransferase [Paraflavitalea sp. CAU 1676]|uniref:glycosyltransferase n=1 Tax=Paraflavitalea sp. CAU 1676 TaxID=3032598 RepID=UPI0023D9BB15|nr:glycosyltransferase [Paraflavitalea sp. CAU 1676]MDF2188290.1 glycosyltransferase [Paraflavitalea sp. CAU 1676]
MKYHKISFCTVCMNRTMHLKSTLLRNIEDNLHYPHLEYVLLNYGSKDDMHDWVQTHFDAYLQSGLLKYYRTDFPDVFKMSHAKNMAFRLATGDILCSIDADNYTGDGFALYVNQLFRKDPAIFLAPPWIAPGKKWWDVQGRLCLWREDYYRFRGYDEGFIDYGYEDQDLKQRMMHAGLRKAVIRNTKFLQAIPHTDQLRMAGGISRKLLANLLLTSIGRHEWELYYLRTDNTYEHYRLHAPQIRIEDAGTLYCSPAILTNLRLHHVDTGRYLLHEKGLTLRDDNRPQPEDLEYRIAQQFSSPGGRLYYRLGPGSLMDQLLLHRSCYLGRQRLLQNRKEPCMVNAQGFGEGAVTAVSGRKMPSILCRTP